MPSARLSRRRTRIGYGNSEAYREGPGAHLPPDIFHCILSIVACNRKRTKFTPNNTLYDAKEGEAKDNLLSCSLVSRAWRLATLPHLFHTVAFYVRHKTFEPSQHECEFGECPCRTIGAFRAVVDARAGVRVNIREVRIGQCHGNTTLSVDPKIDIVELVSLLHHLPNLRVVELQDLTMPDRRLDLWTLPCLFPQSLALDRFSYFAKEDATWATFVVDVFQPLLTTFARVGEMRFSGVKFGTNHITRRLKTPIPLASLRLLRCSSTDSLLSFFTTRSQSSIVPGFLTSMTVANMDDHDAVVAFGRTMRCAGGSIVSLSLSTQFWWGHVGPSTDPGLSLEDCLSLKSLKLQFRISLSGNGGCTPEGLCRTLSSLRPLTKLRNIALVVTCENYYGGTGHGFHGFMGPVELELLQLKTLQRVALVFRLQHEHRRFRYETALPAATVFPTLAQKGLLWPMQRV